MADGPPVLAAIIQRVSDPRRSLGASTDDQEKENREACARRGWVIPPDGVFTEKQSASRFARKAREEWARLTAEVAAGKYGVVVMWESSRADRTPDTWFPFLTACRVTGTLIYVTPQDRVYNLKDEWRDYRTMAEDGIDAAIEVEKLSDRIKRGVRANVTKGRPHGRVVYGYERVYDEKTRRLAEQRPHPDRAPVVSEIKERIAAGEPVSVVTGDLNRRGLKGPGGGVWYRETVRQIALNPVYAGQRYWRGDGQLHPGAWPALVSEETHYAAVLVLSDASRLTTRPGRHVYMLSHVAECGECGSPLAGHPAWPPQQMLPGYRCVRGCTATRVPYLDTYISRLAIRKLSDPQTYALITAGTTEKHSAARAEADGLRIRLDRAAASFAAGKIDIGQLEVINAAVRPALAKAEERLRVLEIPPPLRSLLTPEEDIEERWERAGVAARKQAVKYLFAWIILKRAERRGNTRGFDTGRVEWEWREELR